MLKLIFRKYPNEVKISNSGIIFESTEKTRILLLSTTLQLLVSEKIHKIFGNLIRPFFEESSVFATRSFRLWSAVKIKLRQIKCYFFKRLSSIYSITKQNCKMTHTLT